MAGSADRAAAAWAASPARRSCRCFLAGIGLSVVVSGAQELGDRERLASARTFIFFRDTNLTDALFRAEGPVSLVARSRRRTIARTR